MNKYIALLVVAVLVGGGAFLIWKFYPIGALVSDSAQAPTEGPGLVIEDLVVGNGAYVETSVNDYLYIISYVGKLADDTVFDTSGENPYFYRMGSGQKVAGLDKGLLGMRVGGKRVLVIPPELAYGSTGAGLVPPNSTIVYEVELKNIAHIDTPSEMFNEDAPR